MPAHLSLDLIDGRHDAFGCFARCECSHVGSQIREGNVNLTRAIVTLKKSGFTGFLIDDHVPAMVNDSPYGHRARALAIGHISGLLAAVDELA